MKRTTWNIYYFIILKHPFRVLHNARGEQIQPLSYWWDGGNAKTPILLLPAEIWFPLPSGTLVLLATLFRPFHHNVRNWRWWSRRLVNVRPFIFNFIRKIKTEEFRVTFRNDPEVSFYFNKKSYFVVFALPHILALPSSCFLLSLTSVIDHRARSHRESDLWKKKAMPGGSWGALKPGR